MQNDVRTLLIQGEDVTATELNLLLENLGIRVSRARNYREAQVVLARLGPPPSVIFTDTVLTDGTWADVERLAKVQDPAVPVIVVSRVVNLRLYLDVLDGGASDFIVPPFRDADVAHVVKGALVGRMRGPSGLSRTIRDRRSEVIPDAQNHADARIKAAHA
ncbi:MAG TPA: response regulator [Terriglobia bacterium]|nr:response regulator [Terriglobia bacterium]